MGKVDLPFQYGELQAMGGLLESINALIKDSDAKEEKEAVKKFLREATDTLRFVIVGDAGVGKTSLLAGLFGNMVMEGACSPTVGVTEFRYGEERAEIELGDGGRRVFCPEEVLKGISVVDTQGFCGRWGRLSPAVFKTYLKKSDVLIAAFQADSAGSFEMWDMLEDVEAKKTVFVMTKTDLFSEDVMARSEEKVRRYMSESGIEAPIFRVCLRTPGGADDRDFQDFQDYISKNLIGNNARFQKQIQNLQELKGILREAADSFALRKKQYEADREVLKKINSAMDVFQAGSRERIDQLKEDLKREVYTAVEAYEQEIIVRLNPRQIKEKFPKGYTDFVDYLNYINEGYRKKMTNEVDRKTKEAVRAYLSKLENVFEEATGYIRERESLIKLEDKFYGSMAKDRQEITAKAGHDLQETKAFYGRLTQASEDLFMKIWRERETYEKKTERAAMTGGVAGAAAGAGVVYGVAALAKIGAALSAGTAAATGTTMLSAAAAGIASVGVLVPIAAAIVGAVIIASMAKKIASAKNMQEMEERVQEAIAEFREETSVTKKQITEQIFETVESIFRREITSADKTFADFRMAVNIDGKNIPMLENRMRDISAFLEKIEEAERERLLR